VSVDEPVSLSPYDAAWPRLFEQEATRLASGLEEAQLNIEHIGSTAVPGLLAKPIVDVIIGVADFGRSQGLVDRLVSLGYEQSGQVGVRRYLRKRGEQQFCTPG
jgi:GrpB-like predicted nucleotidyltransferase (UPF0157 family)